MSGNCQVWGAGMQLPGTKLPGMKLPGMKLPGMQLPGMQLPGTKLPGMKLPIFKLHFKKAAHIIYTTPYIITMPAGYVPITCQLRLFAKTIYRDCLLSCLPRLFTETVC